MPDPSTLAVFALAALALVAIPGPNLIYIVTRSIDQGRGAGLASAFGVETATLVHVAAAAAGLSPALASSATAFSIVKYAGAAYLLYLGLRTLLARDRAEGDAARPAAPARRVYAEGFVVNLLNPKVALFFLAFLPQFVDPHAGQAWLQVLTLGAVLVAIGLAIDLLYALAAGSLGSWVRGGAVLERRRRWATGGVYIALAAVALAGSRRAS
ncbi:MAG TPA: LysE family translocator [Thermoleophilaceae bacterium]|jgi:threonine/homoserine/homoserine lactone efflux protein|nr:LysE family translocator [Thermoleophilaceae bacterium]